MPIYVYETIPNESNGPSRRFEVKQSMKDAALTRDPETGLPVRRVIQGVYLNGPRSTESSASNEGGSCCGGNGCGPTC